MLPVKTNSSGRGHVLFIHEQKLRPVLILCLKYLQKKMLLTSYKTDKKILLSFSMVCSRYRFLESA